MTVKNLIEKYDLHELPLRGEALHWTGLVFDLNNLSVKVIVWVLERAESVLTEEEKILRAERWPHFKEAVRYRVELCEWIREKAGSKENLKLFISNYDEACFLGPESFTELVPAEMRKRYKEALDITAAVDRETWRAKIEMGPVKMVREDNPC